MSNKCFQLFFLKVTMLVDWSNRSSLHVRGPATEIARSPISYMSAECQTSDCRQIGDVSGQA